MKLLFFFISISLFANTVFKDINNNPIDLNNYLGKKVVLLNFWATWCTPCKAELPIINKIYSELKDKNFEIISISLDEESESELVKSTVFNMALKFNVIIDANSVICDKYNPQKNAPYSVLFDLSGNIVKRYVGFNSGDEENIKKEIETLLNQEKKEKKEFDYNFSTSLNYYLYGKKETKTINYLSNYDFFKSRTNISLFYKNLSFKTSFHSQNFITSSRDVRDRYDTLNDYRFEKISLSYAYKNQSLTAGDFYITQGKGIALSLNKEDELGIDTTLQGGILNYNIKNIFDGNLFGGRVNNTNLDSVFNEIYDDKNDIILGTTLNITPVKIFKSGLHFNNIMFNEPEFNETYPKPANFEQQTMQIVGGYLSVNKVFDLFDAYFEYDYLNNNFYDKNAVITDSTTNETYKYFDNHLVDNGYAVYGSLNVFIKKLNILSEFKKYKNFQIGIKSDLPSNYKKLEHNNSDEFKRELTGYDSVFYNNLPTLERTGEKVYDAGTNVYGIRTKATYKISENIKPYLNYLYNNSNYKDSGDNYLKVGTYKNIIAHHIYFGSEFYFNELKNKIDASFSYRNEGDYYGYYGINLDANIFINSLFSFELKSYYYLARHEYETEKNNETVKKTDNYQDSESNVSLILFNDLYLSYLFNRYTSGIKNTQDHYHAFELKYKYLSDSFIKLFYGEIRGGLKCIGGVCKDYPPFKGFKTEFVLNF